MENVDIKFWTKGINRCRRFSGMPEILYCLSSTGILPVLKLWTWRKHWLYSVQYCVFTGDQCSHKSWLHWSPVSGYTMYIYLWNRPILQKLTYGLFQLFGTNLWHTHILPQIHKSSLFIIYFIKLWIWIYIFGKFLEYGGNKVLFSGHVNLQNVLFNQKNMSFMCKWDTNMLFVILGPH